MYKYVKTNEAPQDAARSIKTTFNGVVLDDLQGMELRTLNVTGRGIIAPVVSIMPKIGAAGAWINEAQTQLPPRTIGIELEIRTDDFRAAFVRLNQILGTTVGELSFSDDAAFSYTAILQDATDMKELGDAVIITISMLCPTPYKQKALQTSTGATIPATVLTPVKPVSITFVASAAASSFKLTNPRTGKHINVMRSIASGDTVVIDWQPTRKITVKGLPSLANLNITSDYETFDIMAGDTLATVPAGSLTVRFREIAL